VNTDQEALMRGLYFLYQRTKELNSDPRLTKKKAKKKTKKKTKKSRKKKTEKIREVGLVCLFGYEPVLEDPEEMESNESFIKMIGEGEINIEKKKREQ